jgi:hypothetical protein
MLALVGCKKNSVFVIKLIFYPPKKEHELNMLEEEKIGGMVPCP